VVTDDPDRDAIVARRKMFVERAVAAVGIVVGAGLAGCAGDAAGGPDATPIDAGSTVDAAPDAGDAAPTACLCACSVPDESGDGVAGTAAGATLVTGVALRRLRRRRST
jgi:MYXO-CTERM domain-containing protein